METSLTDNFYREERMPEITCSVIVPVYKAEPFIRRCLDSLLAQTFKDFEVLLIDDGSPDNSGMICDEYARKDSRFSVFHKENGGVSSARQYGLDRAHGQYVIHADPDDWIEAAMLEDLCAKAKAEDADMVMCDFYQVEQGITTYISQQPSVLTADGVLNQLLGQQLHGSCWNKMVRRSLFKKFNVSFPVEIICWEDLYVNCELLRHDIKLAYVPKAYYHYDCQTNSGSITHGKDMRRLRSQLMFCDHFTEVLDEKYKDALLEAKRSTKEFAFVTGKIRGRDFVNLYKETNAYYFKHSLLHDMLHSNRIVTGVRIANGGHYRLGKWVCKALKLIEWVGCCGLKD